MATGDWSSDVCSSDLRKVVLLVDEIDKSDDEFEAFLFEILSDFQEIGRASCRERV